MRGILVNVVAGNSAFLFPVKCIHLGCKLVKTMGLAQAAPARHHAPAEVRQIVPPSSNRFLLSVQRVLVALIAVMGSFGGFLQAKGKRLFKVAIPGPFLKQPHI